MYCPAHHMFSQKTNYELSPIFYGQETNYVFLPNCYYVSMTLWSKTFWNLIFENLSKCDAIHESFLTLKLPEDFFEGHFLRVYKNVMLDTNWDTHNHNTPYQYKFSFSLLISPFFVFTVILDLEKWNTQKPLRILRFVLLTNFDYFYLISFIMWIEFFLYSVTIQSF